MTRVNEAVLLMQQRREAIEKGLARSYDLTDDKEILRLYREVRGYLHTCHYKHGTDWEGRRFAMDALDQLIAARTRPNGTEE